MASFWRLHRPSHHIGVRQQQSGSPCFPTLNKLREKWHQILLKFVHSGSVESDPLDETFISLDRMYYLCGGCCCGELNLDICVFVFTLDEAWQMIVVNHWSPPPVGWFGKEMTVLQCVAVWGQLCVCVGICLFVCLFTKTSACGGRGVCAFSEVEMLDQLFPFIEK